MALRTSQKQRGHWEIVDSFQRAAHVCTGLGPEDVSLLETCPHYIGWYVQASMELGPEDMSLLERCPHIRGLYVLAAMELGPEDVSLLEKFPHFRGVYYRLQWSWDLKMCPCPHFRGLYAQASMELGPENVSLFRAVAGTAASAVSAATVSVNIAHMRMRYRVA